MIRRTAILTAIALVLTLTGAGLRNLSAEETSDPKLGKGAYFFDQAIQNYLKGDSNAAIQQLNESLKIDGSNQRAKIFLLKLLVERGSRLFMAKQYQKAYDYLSQAYSMDQSNDQVRQMFEIAARQVKPQQPVTQVMLIPQGMQAEMLKKEAASHSQAIGGAAVTLGQNPAQEAKPMPMYAEPAPMEAPSAQNGGGAPAVLGAEYVKNVSAMMSLLNSFQKRQEKQIDQFTVPLERIQNLYYQSEQDRKNFISQMDTRFKSVLGNVSFQQRMVIYGFIFGLMILAFVVWAFYLIIGRMRSKREEMIMKYQQEMLKMVRDMAALPGASAYGNYLPQGGVAPGYRLQGAPMPQLTANPAAAAAMGGTGGMGAPDPAAELEQMTQTGNFKERAMAAVKMLNLDADRAVDILRGMATSADAFQRENTFFALGAQYHPLTLELLLNGLQDLEPRVQASAARSLRRLEQGTPELSDADRAQIRGALHSQGDDSLDKKKRS